MSKPNCHIVKSYQMPHLEEFFTHDDSISAISCGGSTRPNCRESDRVKGHGVLYLHGPKDAGQTSLLLQFGFTQAKAGQNVTLVLSRSVEASQSSQVTDIVPITPCVHCKRPMQTGEDNSIWSRIKLKNLDTSAELQQFLTSLHTDEHEPSVLLIKSLESFFTAQSPKSDVYQTLAFLLDARDYMQKARGTGLVVVSGQTDAAMLRTRPLLRRWCRFLELVPHIKERNTFLLREEMENGDSGGQVVSKTQIKYTFVPSSEERNGMFQLVNVKQRGE